MNKSALFKKAHEITKSIIRAGFDYRATFGLVLKSIIAGDKKMAQFNIVAAMQVGRVAKKEYNVALTVENGVASAEFESEKYGKIVSNIQEMTSPTHLRVGKSFNAEGRFVPVFTLEIVACEDIATIQTAIKTVNEAAEQERKAEAKAEATKREQAYLESRKAKAKEERKTATVLGAKALTGTIKQKAWAETIRSAVLHMDITDDALSFITQSAVAQTSKFWIETRNIDRKALVGAMNDLIVATREANEIGAGNAGYDEQVAKRAAAMKILGI